MDNLQLQNILSSVMGPLFQGVFAVDEISSLKIKHPAALVVNTGKSTGSGKHWCAMYLNTDKTGVFFDSSGDLANLRLFRRFLDDHCSSWEYCCELLQNPLSLTCGAYCIAFLVDYHMFKFLKHFYDNLN